MENSKEISPLVSFLFPSDRGAARVSEDRDPCQTASLSNGRAPTYVVCLPKGGKNGGSTCAVADPSVALMDVQAQLRRVSTGILTSRPCSGEKDEEEETLHA